MAMAARVCWMNSKSRMDRGFGLWFCFRDDVSNETLKYQAGFWECSYLGIRGWARVCCALIMEGSCVLRRRDLCRVEGGYDAHSLCGYVKARFCKGR